MKVSIIIPAHNEEQRIGTMLSAYSDYFERKQKKTSLEYELVVVLNACSDATDSVVKNMQQKNPKIRLLSLILGGKGRAVRHGFLDALSRDSDLIGFVDADMATSPQAFAALIDDIAKHDGVIASRYMKGAQISPQRPMLKRLGSKLIYEPLVWLLFGLRFNDLQCGAKLFSKEVVERVVQDVSEVGWAFDVELLYLCKRYGFVIVEKPTVWQDKAGSKLRIFSSGMRMMASLFAIRFRHLY